MTLGQFHCFGDKWSKLGWRRNGAEKYLSLCGWRECGGEVPESVGME